MSAIAHSQNPTSSSFTCNSCGIRFLSADLQRVHMKTEWHRYNLKRRVAQLPPISADLFAEKFAQSQMDGSGEDEYGFKVYSKLRSNGRRQLTKKDLKLQQKALRGRHDGFENDATSRDLSPVSVAATEFSNFSLARSLTGTISDYETNSEAFSDASSWVEVDDSELDALEGASDDARDDDSTDDDSTEDGDDHEELIPITSCFYCTQASDSVQENIDHMFKKHGLFIPKDNLTDLEGLLEFLSEVVSIGNECLVCGFFGKNIESVQLHMRAKGHCQLPYETKQDRALFDKFYTTGDSGSEEESDETYVAEMDETGTELILPNGSRLGHRSLLRYWRQNVVLDLVPSEGKRTLLAVDRRLNSGLTLREADKMDLKMKQDEQRAVAAYSRKMNHSKKRGVNFQKHYRDEFLQ